MRINQFLKKKLCFIFFTMLFSIGACRYPKEIRQIENKEGCNNVISFIDENWSYNEKKDIYERTNKFFKRLTATGKYHNCINGLSKEEIKILFGEPNEVHPRALRYYNDTECYDEKGTGYRCQGTSFKLNSKGQVHSISQIGWWSSH